MKKILVGLALLTATSAFAAAGSEARTTDMYAPKAGATDVLGGLGILTGKNEVSGTSTTGSGLTLRAEYAYGFSDYAAFYVQQGYTATEQAASPGTTSKTKGLGDTKIGVKAVVDFAPAFLYYDLGYQMALLEKPKVETNGDVTAGSPRPYLTAQVGGGTNFDVLGLGAKVNVNLYQDGDVDVPGGTVKAKSGSGAGWKVYAQYQSTFKVGASYAEQLDNSYDTTTGGVTTSQPKAFSRTYSVYSIIPVMGTSEVFIDVSNRQGGNSNTTYGQYVVAGTYRMTF